MTHPPLAQRSRPALTCAALSLALVAAMTAGIAWGSVTIPFSTVWQVVTYRLTGWGDPTHWTRIQDGIVWDLRLPRVLLGALVGAGLAVVGVAVQALVRNPLADPYLLGVSSGASLGAVAAIVLGVTAFGVAGTSGAAFAGALASLVVVFALAHGKGGFAPVRLVLAGVAIWYALTGATSYLILQADDPGKTNSVLFWLLGSLSAASWSRLGIPAAALTIGVIILLGRSRAMNALLLGDESAAGLGIRPARLRRELFLVTSLVTGIMVALAGGISFVGLIVPHAVRLIVGSDHRRVLPIAALTGAVFLVLIDLVARFALRPQELPVGIITSLVGAPVFLALMSRRRLGETGS